jgi:hypothetical protein
LGYVCPRTYNPGDYYIQTLAIMPNEREKSLAKANVDLLNLFDRYKLFHIIEFSFCFGSSIYVIDFSNQNINKYCKVLWLK